MHISIIILKVPLVEKQMKVYLELFDFLRIFEDLRIFEENRTMNVYADPYY